MPRMTRDRFDALAAEQSNDFTRRFFQDGPEKEGPRLTGFDASGRVTMVWSVAVDQEIRDGLEAEMAERGLFLIRGALQDSLEEVQRLFAARGCVAAVLTCWGWAMDPDVHRYVAENDVDVAGITDGTEPNAMVTAAVWPREFYTKVGFLLPGTGGPPVFSTDLGPEQQWLLRVLPAPYGRR